MHPGRVDARQRRPFFVEAQVRRGIAQRAPQLAAAHHASADRIRRTQQACRRVEVPGLKGRADAGAGHALAVEHRSEEQTSELQALMRNSYAVLCLKKNKKRISTDQT